MKDILPCGHGLEELAEVGDQIWCAECDTHWLLMYSKMRNPWFYVKDHKLNIGIVQIYTDDRDWWIGYFRGDKWHYVCLLPSVVIRWPRFGKVNA